MKKHSNQPALRAVIYTRCATQEDAQSAFARQQDTCRASTSTGGILIVGGEPIPDAPLGDLILTMMTAMTLSTTCSACGQTLNHT